MTRNSNPGVSGFLSPSVFLFLGGMLLTSGLYGLIWGDVLNLHPLSRLIVGQWACVLTFLSFFTALIDLSKRVVELWRQQDLLPDASEALSGLVRAPDTVEPSERARWLKTLWGAQPYSVLESWLGQRVAKLVERQAKRRSGLNLDEDLRDLARRDSDRRRESYGLIHMSCWAMAFFGILGAFSGFYQLMGKLKPPSFDVPLPEATVQITTALSGTFGTLSLALALTAFTLCIVHLLKRLESRLLTQIDDVIAQNVIGFLVTDEDASSSKQEALWKRLSHDLISMMQRLVEQQSIIWRGTIDEAHTHWTNLAQSHGEQVQRALGESIDQSLDKHAKYLEQVQRKGAEAIDTRWQQWQLALSEQARAIHSQQKEIVRQSELLAKLADTSAELPKLQERIETNLQQLANIDRFSAAALGMTEAVATLTTQIERIAAQQVRTPVRRTIPAPLAKEGFADESHQERQGRAA